MDCCKDKCNKNCRDSPSDNPKLFSRIVKNTRLHALDSNFACLLSPLHLLTYVTNNSQWQELDAPLSKVAHHSYATCSMFPDQSYFSVLKAPLPWQQATFAHSSTLRCYWSSILGPCNIFFVACAGISAQLCEQTGCGNDCTEQKYLYHMVNTQWVWHMQNKATRLLTRIHKLEDKFLCEITVQCTEAN